MPLLKHRKEDKFRFAIWKIEEPEAYFQQITGLSAQQKLARRRLEFLAGRFLLHLLAPGFPFENIQINQYGKPFIPAEGFHFSISHSFPYVAAAISATAVGIDVQTFQEKICRLQKKFLSEREQLLFQNDMSQITLAWAAKEAVFKWTDLAGIDFIKHMPINDYHLGNRKAGMAISFQKQEPFRAVVLTGGLEEDYGWMVTIPD